ncbi:glycosyltransferase, partial [Marisediminicola senii]|uniref:glycosyltransferase n=1 Tax=Marisediminicola senii TaxID=2711233 RepID=UPI0022A73994
WQKSKDPPQARPYDAADRRVAPWPDGRPLAPSLAAVARKVAAVGGISRFDGRASGGAGARTDGSVLLLGGGGSSPVTAEQLAAAASITPTATWSMLGAGGDGGRIAGVRALPWTDDPWPLLSTAGVVVAWAGQNSVADLAAADARAIVIPQPRPFGEQDATAAALDDDGLAVVVPQWPEAAEWPGLLDAALALDVDWARWQVPGAAARAAAVIAGVAMAGLS